MKTNILKKNISMCRIRYISVNITIHLHILISCFYITNILQIDEGGKIKSSRDFFSRLQETVDKKNQKTEIPHKKKKK